MSAAAGDHHGLTTASPWRGGSDSSPQAETKMNSQLDPGPSALSVLSRGGWIEGKRTEKKKINGDGDDDDGGEDKSQLPVLHHQFSVQFARMPQIIHRKIL
jgi:hypothetical protein